MGKFIHIKSGTIPIFLGEKEENINDVETLLLERLQKKTEMEFDIEDVRSELSRRLGKKR